MPAEAAYTRITNPDAIFDDNPDYISPILPNEFRRYLESPIVENAGGDISLRAWRFSPMVGGLAESYNVLASEKTALIVVHPWGIEDGQGWDFPQAYNASGYAFMGTLPDNIHYNNHVNDVVKGLVDSLRGRLPLVVYGMPGSADDTRYNIYRDYTHQPSLADRVVGQAEMEDYLSDLSGSEQPDRIPVNQNLQAAPGDVVAYDDLGYAQLKSYLQSYGIENVILAGYAANTTLSKSTCGYMNLKKDFKVFVVGDATMSTWPKTTNPPSGFTRISTRNAIFAATIESGVAATQVSWLEAQVRDPAGGPSWRGEERTCLAEWYNWQKPGGEGDPLFALGRAPDYLQTNLDPAVYSGGCYIEGFDAGKIELVGQYGGRINAAKVCAGEELVLNLPDPVEFPDRGLLRVQITWSRGVAGQEPLWTLDLHDGAGGVGEEQLSHRSRTIADGWLTDVYESELGRDVSSTILRLAFGDQAAYIDSIVVDLQMGAVNLYDEYEATLMAANWGKHGEAGMPGDFNGDGWVNSLDAQVLAENWLQPFSSATITAVPEPSLAAGWWLLAVLLACRLKAELQTGLKKL